MLCGTDTDAGHDTTWSRYIWQLPFEEAERAVQRDGKVLAMALPSETTALLKALCTGVSRSDILTHRRTVGGASQHGHAPI